MNPASDKQVSHGGAGEEPGTSLFTSPEDLLSFARDYYADDFPNPERRGCPTPVDLESQARSGRLPDETLRSHLFGCSECFRAYRGALAARAAAPNERPAADSSRAERPEDASGREWLPVFAGSLSLLILLYAGLYFWQRYKPSHDDAVTRTEPTQTQVSSETNADSVVESAEPAPSQMPPEPSKTPQQRETPQPEHVPRRQGSGTELAAVVPVGVDLRKYVITRGTGAGGADESIRLPRARTRLLLKLPEGSDPGTYNVSIIDGSGKTLASAPKAKSADGRSLSATIDTTDIAPQKYILRVLRQGAMADFYPLVISGPVNATP